MTPAFKPINKDDISTKINTIVDELQRQSDSKTTVTELVTDISKTYGLKKPIIRAAATALFKHNVEEAEEKNKEILSIIDMCL